MLVYIRLTNFLTIKGVERINYVFPGCSDIFHLKRQPEVADKIQYYSSKKNKKAETKVKMGTLSVSRCLQSLPHRGVWRVYIETLTLPYNLNLRRPFPYSSTSTVKTNILWSPML